MEVLTIIMITGIVPDYLSEWVERGFKACDLINILINQYCKSAFGSLF